MNTKSALETRRRALEKYLGIICQHPLVRRCDVFMLFMWCGGDDERDNLSSLSFYISSSEPVSSSSSLQLPQTSPASTTNSHEEKIMTVYEDEDEWLTGMKQHDQAIEAADRAAGFTDRDAGFSSSTITSHFLSRVNLLPSRGIQQQQQDRRTITGFENHLGLLTEHLSELAASSGSTNTSSSIGAGGTSSSLIEKSTLGLNLVVGGGGDYETNNCCSHNHGPFSKPTTDAIKVVAIGKQTDMAANKRSIREFSYCWRPSCTDCKMTSEHLVALSECMEHVRLAQLQQCGSVVSPFMESLSKDLASLVPGYVGVTEFYRLAEKKFVVLDQEGGQNGDQDAGTANNNNNSNMKKLDTIRGVCLAE